MTHAQLRRSSLISGRVLRMASGWLTGLAATCAGGLFEITALSNSVSAAEIPVATVDHPEPVDFAVEILPILRRNCLACHSASVAEGDLVLETPDAMLKGGNEGPSIVPGNAEESWLFQLATHRAEPVMPPEGNKAQAANLTSEELGLLKLWIDQGATPGSLGSMAVEFESLPAGVSPVYAVAISPDGRTLAAARANQVFLNQLPSKRSLGRLTDPDLMARGLYDRPGVADVDLVQALAFSPDGQRLATGGFRSVKLWSRQAPGITAGMDVSGAIRSVAMSLDGTTLFVIHDPNSLAIVNTADATLRADLSTGDLAVERIATVSDAGLLFGTVGNSLIAWRLVDGALQELGRTEVESGVVGLVSVPNRNRVAVAGTDNVLRIFEAPAAAADPNAPTPWAPIATLASHGQPITAMASGMAAPELVTGDAGGQLVVWDMENHQASRTLGHGSPVRALSIDVTARRIASFGDGRSVRVWNADDGVAMGQRDGSWLLELNSGKSAQRVALAARHVELANQDLAAAQAQKTAEETNLNAAKEAVTKATEAQTQKQAAYDPLGAARDQAQTALTAAQAEVTRIEQEIAAAEAARVAAEATSNELKAKFDALSQDPAQAEAAAAAGKELEAAQATLDAATKRKQELEATLAPAQQTFQAADAAFKAADEPAKKAQDELTAAQRALEGATRTSERAAEAMQRATDAIPGFEAAVQQADAKRVELQASADTAAQAFQNERTPFIGAMLGAGGALSVALTADGRLTGWNLAEGSIAFEEAMLERSAAGDAPQVIVAATLDAAGRNWIGVGNRLSVISSEESWVWERTIGDFQGDSPFADRVMCLDFSPDGSVLAVGGGLPSRSGTLTLIDVASGAVVSDFAQPHSDVLLAVRFSPDGKTIASSATDRFMKTFDVATGTAIRGFEGHTAHVQSVAWSADGRTLVTSGSDSVLKVWNAATGEQLRTIPGFGKEVTGVRFMGLTTFVAASSGDRNVHVKNSADGGNVRQLGGFGDFVYCVDVSWDGKVIAGAGLDSVVRVWKEDGTAIAEFAPPAPE